MVIKDLTPQKTLRTPEEMLKHLNETTLVPKYSAGVWYFYPGASRFHEPYVDKGTIEETLNKVAWMHDEGYIDSSFGLEAHFPNEVNWENLHLYRNLEKETGIKLLTAIPFLFLQAVGLALVVIFPEIILWLPRLVYGN